MVVIVWFFEFESRSWFSLGTIVSSNNKTDRHDITEIVLKVTLNAIKTKPKSHLERKWDRFASEIFRGKGETLKPTYTSDIQYQ